MYMHIYVYICIYYIYIIYILSMYLYTHTYMVYMSKSACCHFLSKESNPGSMCCIDSELEVSKCKQKLAQGQ